MDNRKSGLCMEVGRRLLFVITGIMGMLFSLPKIWSRETTMTCSSTGDIPINKRR